MIPGPSVSPVSRWNSRQSQMASLVRLVSSSGEQACVRQHCNDGSRQSRHWSTAPVRSRRRRRPPAPGPQPAANSACGYCPGGWLGRPPELAAAKDPVVGLPSARFITSENVARVGADTHEGRRRSAAPSLVARALRMLLLSPPQRHQHAESAGGEQKERGRLRNDVRVVVAAVVAALVVEQDVDGLTGSEGG